MRLFVFNKKTGACRSHGVMLLDIEAYLEHGSSFSATTLAAAHCSSSSSVHN